MTSIHVTGEVTWANAGSKTYACAFSGARDALEHEVRAFIVPKINDPVFELSIIELLQTGGTRHPGGGTATLSGYLYKAFVDASSTTDEAIGTDVSYTTYIVTLLEEDIAAMNATTSGFQSHDLP